MDKFEYQILELKISEISVKKEKGQDKLNKLGVDGWEVVCQSSIGTHMYFILKRKI